MTSAEIFDAGIPGGTNDFRLVIRLCRETGPYCLIGGVAVNSYVAPVNTEDVDLVIHSARLPELRAKLEGLGFKIQEFPYSVNATLPESKLRIQFTTMPRYEEFIARAESRMIWEESVMVAALADLFQGKLWAAQDPTRRTSKKLKDLTDLARIAESYPEFVEKLPPAVRQLMQSVVSEYPGETPGPKSAG